MFKFVIVCVVLLQLCFARNMTIVRFPPEVAALMHRSSATCKKPGDDLASYHSIIREGRISEDPAFKAFVTCVIRTNGYSDEHGKFLVAKTAAVYPKPQLMADMITRCNDAATGTDPVEVLFQAFKCFQKETPYEMDY